MKPRWIVSTALLMLAACGGQSGSDYLGTWQRSSTSHESDFSGGDVATTLKDTITIDRNGDGFMIRSARIMTMSGQKPLAYPETKQPASLKDGQLQVAGGLGGVYVIDKASGHLVPPGGAGDYTRSK